jgi:hypothetical protein
MDSKKHNSHPSWTNEQTLGFMSTALQVSALRWFNALQVTGINQNDWEEVKKDLWERYSTQINATNTCKGIAKLTQSNRSVLDYFSEVEEVVKMLAKLTSKKYKTDLLVRNEIITEADGAETEVYMQLNRFFWIIRP